MEVNKDKETSESLGEISPWLLTVLRVRFESSYSARFESPCLSSDLIPALSPGSNAQAGSSCSHFFGELCSLSFQCLPGCSDPNTTNWSSSHPFT